MSKVFNRDVELRGNAKLTKNGVTLIDGDGNIDAPVTTTNLTTSGTTTLGDAGDAVQLNGPTTVGVNDTGYDVKLFGATAGKSWLWDESADKMIVTGASDLLGNTQQTGTFTVGVDDTGHDVKFFGATAGKSLLWDESADKLIITGSASSSEAITASAGVNGAVATVWSQFAPVTVQQDLSGAGAVNLTTYYTAVTNTGADALTLADSTVLGQVKKVKMIVDPGTDSTLTFNTNATIVFADVGDYAILVWDGSDWIPVELGNDADGTSAPAYTPAS